MDINDILNLNKIDKENLLKKTEEILVNSEINFTFNSVEGYGYITGIGIPNGVNNTGYKETDLLLQYLLLKKLVA